MLFNFFLNEIFDGKTQKHKNEYFQAITYLLSCDEYDRPDYHIRRLI